MAADLLSLALLTPPGEWGADVVVGDSQRLFFAGGIGAKRYFFSDDVDAGLVDIAWDVMPTMRLTENDRDYAIVGAIPVEAEGITYIYGRQSCDTRP